MRRKWTLTPFLILISLSSIFVTTKGVLADDVDRRLFLLSSILLINDPHCEHIECPLKWERNVRMGVLGEVSKYIAEEILFNAKEVQRDIGNKIEFSSVPNFIFIGVKKSDAMKVYREDTIINGAFLSLDDKIKFLSNFSSVEAPCTSHVAVNIGITGAIIIFDVLSDNVKISRCLRKNFFIALGALGRPPRDVDSILSGSGDYGGDLTQIDHAALALLYDSRMPVSATTKQAMNRAREIIQTR